MSPSEETIFRQEALEEHARGPKEERAAVRLSHRWLTRLYWLIVTLFVAGVICIFVVRTEETSSGTAVVDGGSGSVTVLLPAPAAPDLAGAEKVTVELPDAGGRTVPLTGLDAELAEDDAVRRAGLEPLPQGNILLTGRLPESALGAVSEDGPVQARATVVLRSERLADVLGRQLRMVFGHPEDQP